VIRVYDEAGNVIETHELAGEFKAWRFLTGITPRSPSKTMSEPSTRGHDARFVSNEPVGPACAASDPKNIFKDETIGRIVAKLMMSSTIMNVVKREKLPFAGVSHEFVGNQHGVLNSILFVSAPPGCRIPLHRYDYDEIIIVQEGRAMCTVGDKEHQVGAGDIIPIPAGTPHGFTNIGEVPLCQIDIHAPRALPQPWNTRTTP
jgi:mannose-6-phosphate isomerase-like protein (cupin superfamily)